MRRRLLPLLLVVPLVLLIAAATSPPGRLIRAGERLRISVVGLMGEGVETRLLRRVADDGTIRLPMLDADSLDATGMTADELERELARRYERQTDARRPMVVVSRMDLGEDHAITPGRDDLASDPTLTRVDGRPPAELERVLPEPLVLRGVPARDALARVAEAYKLPLVVDWRFLSEAAIEPGRPLDLTLAAGTRASHAMSQLFGRMEAGVASPHGTGGLHWTYYRNALVVTTYPGLEQYAATVVIDIRPLLAGRDRSAGLPREEYVQRIIDLVTTTVATDSWQVNGGNVGRIAELDGHLIVTATPETLGGVAARLGEGLPCAHGCAPPNLRRRKIFRRFGTRHGHFPAGGARLSAQTRTATGRV